MFNAKPLKLTFALGLVVLVFIFIMLRIQDAARYAQALKDSNHPHTPLLLDSEGRPMNETKILTLDHIPTFLIQAFLTSEDQRFYQHHGVDWQAKMAALYQTLASLFKKNKTRRGGSSMTEQVVRILKPRPRTLSSKCLETLEALALEWFLPKREILTFYLNQLPYAGLEKGVQQAANYFFDRDLNTLTVKEALALVVMARAPSAFNLYRHPKALEPMILSLARKIHLEQAITKTALSLHRSKKATVPIQAFKADLHAASSPLSKLFRAQKLSIQPIQAIQAIQQTTLDRTLQITVQSVLDQHMKTLQSAHVEDAAALVVDHQTGEIKAWVTDKNRSRPTVILPRHAGSSLKPFLYALALDKGWAPDTVIEDAPLWRTVGSGLHRFRNYSHVYYGPVTLKEALGNSLNIPAIKTLDYVGLETYLKVLHQLGFKHLDSKPEVYGQGLALGNGDVSLFELVQAYTALAQGGCLKRLTAFRQENPKSFDTQAPCLFSQASSLVIARMLSDPWARQWEFGRYSLLDLIPETAVKTGTSSDYRDAWAIGFNHRYVVGVFMGNLSYRPMDGITGAKGPAIVLQTIFSKLNQMTENKPLSVLSYAAYQNNKLPHRVLSKAKNKAARLLSPDIIMPTPNLLLAMDPRVSRTQQGLAFELAGFQPGDIVKWTVDAGPPHLAQSPVWVWPLKPGQHRVRAELMRKGKSVFHSQPVDFRVKP